jgi:hypothetical protein
MFDLQIWMSAIIGVGLIAGIKLFKCRSRRFASFNNRDDDNDDGCVSNTLIGNTEKLYLSFDIEADGPSPTVNSMLSIGIYGFNGRGDEVVSYQRNIEPLRNRIMDKQTKEDFWDKNPEMYEFIRTNRISPQQCMSEIADIYNKYKNTHKITWVAWPSAYDWQWLNSYYHEFGPNDKPDIGFSAKCISTALWIYCKQNGLSKRQEKELWTELRGCESVTHNPLDDSRCQGKVMFGLMDKYGIVL